MNLQAIIDFMEELAPKTAAMEYDNVGLLVGRGDKEVTKILTALDCTADVVREAVEKGCELIVCHHPVMFSGVKSITDETKEGEMLLVAIENNVAIFACHTNLDFAQGGLNDYFLEKLGYEACGTIKENEGRVFDAKGITIKDLCGKIKSVFDILYIRVAGDVNHEISRCGLCTGSGKSLALDAVNVADCYITGDMGHHDILNLLDMGGCYIEVSHYDSEKIAMELLERKLKEKFSDTEVLISCENKNPLTFV